MADLATLQSRLSEAEEALHKLATGARAATTGIADRTVTWTQTTIPELQTYITALRSEIVAAGPSPSRAFTVQTSRGLS